MNTFLFTANYNADMQRHIDDLYTAAKTLITSRQERLQASDDLVEAYVSYTGKRPDSTALGRLATLILRDELTDPHPDKMTINEYPILSGWQEESRESKFMPKAELPYGDMRFLGKRKVAIENKTGVYSGGKRRIINKEDPLIGQTETLIDLFNAIDKAKLTSRQRQVIDLLYFGKMNQSNAGVEMGVSQQAICQFESAALRKLNAVMT